MRVLTYVKKEMIVMTVVLAAFSVSAYLYGSRNLNIKEKKERVRSLEREIASLEKKVSALEREKRKNDEFFRSHPGLKFVPSASKEMGRYRFEKRLASILETFFGDGWRIGRIKTSRRGSFVIYETEIVFPYVNRKRTERFFEYLKNDVYSYEGMKFDGKNVRVKLKFVGKK